MKPLNVGIVGAGYIAQKKHIPAFKCEKRVKITAIMAPSKEEVMKVAQKFDIPRFYTDFLDMLVKEKLDIVSICTPPQTHAQLAISAMEHNSHVLVEKPIAVSSKEAQKMIEASEKNKLKLCVVHNLLFDRSVQKALKLLNQGSLGDLIFISVNHITMLRVELPKWVYELPAALIYDEGVHMAYLVSAFLKNVKVVRALFRKFHELPTHLPYDYFESTLENDEGALASIRGFYSAPRTEWMMSIVGTKKILIIDNLRDTLITMGYRKFSPCAFALSGVRSLYQQGVGMSSRAIRYILKRDSHRVIISRFVSSILEDKPPPITAYEGKRAVEIMDNIMRFL